MNVTNTIRYKKPEAVRELENLAYEVHYRDSTLPEYVRTKFHFRDDSANSLTTCITAFLKLKGAFVSRLNNTGIYDRRTGKYRPGTNRRGLPDIICSYRSRSIFIECKYGRDQLSEHQMKVKAEQEASGGLFYVARNFTDFKTWFEIQFPEIRVKTKSDAE